MTDRRAPKGFHFDPFADARMGLSLFQMRDEDWLVPAQPDQSPQGQDPQGLGAKHASGVAEGHAPTTNLGSQNND